MFHDLDKTHTAFQTYTLPPYDPSQIYTYVQHARRLRAHAMADGVRMFIVTPVKAIVRRVIDAVSQGNRATGRTA